MTCWPGVISHLFGLMADVWVRGESYIKSQTFVVVVVVFLDKVLVNYWEMACAPVITIERALPVHFMLHQFFFWFFFWFVFMLSFLLHHHCSFVYINSFVLKSCCTVLEILTPRFLLPLLSNTVMALLLQKKKTQNLSHKWVIEMM